MSPYARVHSVVLLKALKASLATFSDAAAVALDEVSTDVQRTRAWLNEDRQRYWSNQVRACAERVTQAKLALKQKNVLDRALSGTTSSAVEERKALAIAERRLREAQSKLSRTRSWIQQIDKLQSDYRSGVQGLVSAIDVDIPNAMARLEKMIDSLEAYVALAPPEAPVTSEKTSQESVLRPAPAPVGRDRRAFAKRLRSRIPAPQTRAEARPAAVPEWVSAIAIPDASFADQPCAPAPEDRVLIACAEQTPTVFFLARTRTADGDSGWFLGLGDETELRGHVAVRAADLLQVQPPLRKVLSMPEGSLVVIEPPNATVTVFDADDSVLWTSSNDDAPAATQ
ncbi:MAG TPA: hypothetical protein PLU87_19375 [Sedimentisphaerales bacterium]|nr:hypothetical protein [Sedimentisphaerales bacterium]HRS13249.1 hypothetical protein [Sedimentisphaerales bacterium]HRV49863.1 hypothetical protein [Sedimentisphaerales bacterium]